MANRSKRTISAEDFKFDDGQQAPRDQGSDTRQLPGGGRTAKPIGKRNRAPAPQPPVRSNAYQGIRGGKQRTESPKPVTQQEVEAATSVHYDPSGDHFTVPDGDDGDDLLLWDTNDVIADPPRTRKRETRSAPISSKHTDPRVKFSDIVADLDDDELPDLERLTSGPPPDFEAQLDRLEIPVPRRREVPKPVVDDAFAPPASFKPMSNYNPMRLNAPKSIQRAMDTRDITKRFNVAMTISEENPQVSASTSGDLMFEVIGTLKVPLSRSKERIGGGQDWADVKYNDFSPYYHQLAKAMGIPSKTIIRNVTLSREMGEWMLTAIFVNEEGAPKPVHITKTALIDWATDLWNSITDVIQTKPMLSSNAGPWKNFMQSDFLLAAYVLLPEDEFLYYMFHEFSTPRMLMLDADADKTNPKVRVATVELGTGTTCLITMYHATIKELFQVRMSVRMYMRKQAGIVDA